MEYSFAFSKIPEDKQRSLSNKFGMTKKMIGVKAKQKCHKENDRADRNNNLDEKDRNAFQHFLPEIKHRSLAKLARDVFSLR